MVLVGEALVQLSATMPNTVKQGEAVGDGHSGQAAACASLNVICRTAAGAATGDRERPHRIEAGIGVHNCMRLAFDRSMTGRPLPLGTTCSFRVDTALHSKESAAQTCSPGAQLRR